MARFAPTVQMRPRNIEFRSLFLNMRQCLMAWILLLPAMMFFVWLVLGYGFLFRESFNEWTPSEGTVPAFGLAQYIRFFTTPLYFNGLLTTFKVAFSVTVLTVFWSYPLAYHMARSPRVNIYLTLAILPLYITIIVRAYAWLVLLAPSGLVNKGL